MGRGLLDPGIMEETNGPGGVPGPVDAAPAPAGAGVDEPRAGEGWLVQALTARGVSRRRFLQWCSAMTAALALPPSYTPKVVQALSGTQRPVIVWLEFQDCAGNTESMLRTSHPDIASVVLDLFSLEYHETVMAGAGAAAEAVLDKVKSTTGYIVVIEGAIPTKDNGVYCMINGKTAVQIAQEVAANAGLVIAVGDCAWDGGFVTQGPTGALGVGDAIHPKAPLINLSGCPHNSANTAATLVHYLTFGQAPALDQYNRPLFAYGHLIHDQCERRANFDAGRFVEQWGDEGHRNGWCLYKMGCKGPGTRYNCPIVRWNDETNWPIGAGHGCIGCAAPRFWDTMSPFYGRLPDVKLLGVDTQAQTIGLAAIGAVAAATAVHATGVVISRRRAARRAAAGGGPGPAAPPPDAGPPTTPGAAS